ncbi:MAG TPA: potassium channel family protein [Solirubrobacteraceae bacterium]|nr:potassium channel family protein [Solirubrobacteraceae bacterium]
MSQVGTARASVDTKRDASFRYGIVLLIVLVLLVFEVLTPETDLSRAVGIALAGGALSVSVATSRARAEVRRVRTVSVGALAALVVIGILVGAVSDTATYVIGTMLIAAIPIALGGGLLRLIRDEGVTVQAVAGALAVYLLVGLLFASAIAFVTKVESAPYFAQGSQINNGDIVYYSFTVMTTTGFGDYTAAHPIGHALAVLEMLIGQLYLVTVIGVLIGNFVGRTRR